MSVRSAVTVGILTVGELLYKLFSSGLCSTFSPPPPRHERQQTDGRPVIVEARY